MRIPSATGMDGALLVIKSDFLSEASSKVRQCNRMGMYVVDRPCAALFHKVEVSPMVFSFP